MPGRELVKASSVAAPQIMPWLGYLIATTGDRASAAEFIRRREAERGHNAFVSLAQAWTYLGEEDTTAPGSPG
jgi:hypothetical protein